MTTMTIMELKTIKETGSPFKWADQINIWISPNGDVGCVVYHVLGARPFIYL